MLKVKTNSNRELVEEIRKKLKENDGYCPCALIHEPDTKCMCKDFRDKFTTGETGECHCGLYLIEENTKDN